MDRETQNRLEQRCQSPELKQVLATLADFDPARFAFPRKDGWALRWETMQLLARLMEVMQPRRVIEFGSGRSTVVLAALAGRYGGRVLSFDHVADFARHTAASLHELEAEKAAQVVEQPITVRRYGAKLLPVYGIRWEEFAEFSDCDLAFVDGPPWNIGREAVLYEVFPRLAVGGWIVVDDMKRPHEQRWLQSWKRVFGDALEVNVFLEIGDGVALMRKRTEVQPTYRFGFREVLESWHHIARLARDGHLHWSVRP